MLDIKLVCQFLSEASAAGKASALVMVCAVEGSSMRNPGTIMGVADDGSWAGSLSGGCIEEAVVAEALDMLKQGEPRMVRFGAGSPYLDIKLPCGGGLDLHFSAVRGADFPSDCLAALEARQPFAIAVGPNDPSLLKEWCAPSFDRETKQGVFGYWPEPKLQIVGHGTGVEALAMLGRNMGCSIEVLTPDKRLISRIPSGAKQLERINQSELLESDPWTATIFLFHDHDWEIELMAHALKLPHFYIGAMGGRKAHAFRSEALASRGVNADTIATIRAPIGLFHSSRDPHTLALSTLAEVIRTYEATDFAAAITEATHG